MRFRGVRDALRDLEDEGVCDLVAQWNGRVGVHGVEALALLDYVLDNWDWRGVPCRC